MLPQLPAVSAIHDARSILRVWHLKKKGPLHKYEYLLLKGRGKVYKVGLEGKSRVEKSRKDENRVICNDMLAYEDLASMKCYPLGIKDTLC